MNGSLVAMPLTNAESTAVAGLAIGLALRNVSAANEQDLMFMAGEKVVLLERLENGECMSNSFTHFVTGEWPEGGVKNTGLCEGVVGRFNEADVDFTIPGAAPPVPAKSRSRASSAASSNSFDRKSRHPQSTALDDLPSAFSVLARQTLLTAIAMDPHATERPGPRKLLSEENLKVASTGSVGRRQVLSSPPAPLQEPSSAPVIPPRSSSRQSAKSASKSDCTSPHLHPNGYPRQRNTPDLLSPGSLSNSSSMSSLGDMNTSSATINTDSLEIKSNELSVPDMPPQPQHRPKLLAKSSNNSLSSRTSSPVNFHAAGTSRPITPILENNHALQQQQQQTLQSSDIPHVVSPNSNAQCPLTKEVDLSSCSSQDTPQTKVHDDHHYSAMLDDIRSKTNHVLQKARFSMSPHAGLYADHGAKDLDMNVVQMPTSFPADSIKQQYAQQTIVSISTAEPSETTLETSSSITGVTCTIPEKSDQASTSGSSILSAKESSYPSRPVSPTSPTSLGFRFDKLRPWVKTENRQRSNSGPARHSDSSILQQLDSSRNPPVQQPQKNGSGETKPRQRRVSEAVAVSVFSTHSAKSCPQQPPFGSPLTHVLSSESKDSDGGSSNKNRTKIGWFSRSNRTSGQLAEDPRKPHALGHGIEGGITASHRQSLGILSDYEEDEEDTDAEGDDGNETEAEGRKSPDPNGSAHLFINDYGFIYDLEDDSNQGQDLSGTGSTVSEWGNMSETEKKRAIRKQNYNRENEIKWVHAATRLNADHVRKSSKYKKLVRRGVPTSVRGRVWLFLAKADFYRKPGLFEDLQKRGPLPIHEVIERDIHRCYPDHVHFRSGMGGTGQQDLQAILRAYAHYKPSVGYCQGMGRLVGMMLMQMPVEDAFWLLVATIEGYMQDYYTPTLRQLRIDAQVFSRLLKEQDPILSEHLEKNDVIPLMYMTQWFMTLFTMSLPWASVLRVWDVFYFDGVKALFRVGLAILQLCRDYLLNKCPSSSELLAYILHIPLEILAPKQLLEASLQIKLKKQDVRKLISATAETMDQTEKEASQRSKTIAQVESSSSTTATTTITTIATSPAIATTNTPATSATEQPQSVNGSAKAKAESTQTQQSSQSSKDLKKPEPHHPPTSSTKSIHSAPDTTPTAAPPSSGSSSFSPLRVFKPRKRSGTVHN